MISFMNGKSPFDEAEEKLEQGINPHDPKVKLKMQGPIMSWQDGLFLLVLIGLVVGGYYYYQYIKKMVPTPLHAATPSIPLLLPMTLFLQRLKPATTALGN